MLTFSYTVSLHLRDTLRTIDDLRASILTIPLPLKTETKLSWEALAIRTWATLDLDGFSIPKNHVATILANATKPTAATRMIYGQRAAYTYIHEIWRANPNEITVTAMETIYALVHEGGERAHMHFRTFEDEVRELLAYIEAKSEHPIIQSAIFHMHMLARDGLFARVASYLILAKYGYDTRGYITLERVWQSDHSAYQHLKETYLMDAKLTDWIDYVADSFVINLQMIQKDIKSSRFYIEFPPSFWLISDRQKDILWESENPGTKITNRHVQKKFHISQITASRDLTKLVSQGLLFPHGKGRSVYYTKI